MEHIQVRLDVEAEPWVDLLDKPITMGKIKRAGMLRHGTKEGRATIALVGEMEDGTTVILETTWRLFKMAYTLMAASPVAAEEVE